MDMPLLMKRHLSTLIMIIVYLLVAVFHILSDSFQLDSQLSLLTMMLPFILYGVSLDFALSRGTVEDSLYQIIGKILPIGIFIIQIINTVLLYNHNESSELLNVSLWIFLAIPFFMASYSSVNFRTDIIRSLVISGIVMIVYGYLSTQTENLYAGNGIILYYITYVLIFYVITQFKIFPYCDIVLGIVNILVLLSYRFLPLTQDTKLHGWDYNILLYFEILLVLTLVLAIILRILSIVLSKKE